MEDISIKSMPYLSGYVYLERKLGRRVMGGELRALIYYFHGLGFDARMEL